MMTPEPEFERERIEVSRQEAEQNSLSRRKPPPGAKCYQEGGLYFYERENDNAIRLLNGVKPICER